MTYDEQSDNKNDVINLQHLPENSRNYFKRMRVCLDCHFIIFGKQETCPNCKNQNVILLPPTNPVISVLRPQESFLIKLIRNQTGHQDFIPGFYAETIDQGDDQLEVDE
ncbi:hypothetical protein SS50377_25247 [Spironucleus salmonicida]|uniref:Spt4/RpoE2 zinc finger domain-containing protein n=1 Tax=Spironucleus salmonicida TaxID=348837 RepID=V6LBQ9_9EUKA|nr:hypothetical protein SS50377_25247 [Spironucleus salmonicida]|eukprot:EST41872.1 hypothetical protein SS50377_18708 [Spironucleus salmonicida]